MIINVIKNNKGETIQWTDTEDNRTTKVVDYRHKHFCSCCGNSVNNMTFISEIGYYERTVTLKCNKCNTIVKYNG